MMPRGLWRGVLVVALGALFCLSLPATAQRNRPLIQMPPPLPKPKLEPVAETKLLMEGLNQSNYRGLERLLKDRPGDAESWAFARGQALLIAETGNLLMLRPPKNRGQDAWMAHAAELRTSATALARHAGARDYARSRSALKDLAVRCNRCHQTFRVSVRVGTEPSGIRDAE
jgi:hypothetical protein